jgi:hypothetical protein
LTHHIGPTVGDSHDQVTPVTSHGWQADLHVTAIDGGDVTVAVQDSADGSTWADLTDGTFTPCAGPDVQHLVGAPGSTVRRYLRAKTDGDFTSANYVVSFVRYEAPPDAPPVSRAVPVRGKPPETQAATQPAATVPGRPK